MKAGPAKRLSEPVARFLLNKDHLTIRVALIALLIVGPVVLFPGNEFTQYSEYKIGTFSPQEIRAPFTFPVYKSQDQLETERREAEGLIAPIFDRNHDVSKLQLASLDELLTYVHQVRNTPKPFQYTDNEGKQQTYVPQAFDSLKNKMNKSFAINIVEDRWQTLLVKEPSTEPSARLSARKDSASRLLTRTKIGRSLTTAQFREFCQDLERILSDQFALGIVNLDKNDFKSPISPITIRNGDHETTEFIKNLNDMDEARYRVQDMLKNYYQDGRLVNMGYEILSKFITPNVLYNDYETKRRRNDAVNTVPQTFGFVLEGDVIVNKNETVTSTIHQQLKSLESAWAEKRSLEGGIAWILPYIGRGLLVFSMMFFLLAYLFFGRRDILENVQKLSLLVILVLLELVFYYVFIHIFDFPVFVIPIVLCSVLLTTLFDVRLGFIGTASISFLIGAMQGNEYTTTIVLLFVGSIACLTVVNFSLRRHVFNSILWVSLAYIFIIVTTSFVKYNDFTEIFSRDLPYGIVSGVLSMLFAFGFLVLFESIFDVCTTFTLLELSDSNHPLLQQLAIKAPGTYHHSVIVSGLAKTGAEAIGVNALLARVGALYHDIGKMDMPEYFVENQMAGNNKHDNLTPRMSAMVLISHVKAGVDMADKYRLPKVIRNFIPEHHGHQLVTYFYQKALELKGPDEVLEEHEFRYPGPRPRTKESGILMLADGVEAATHSIKDPSAEKIRAMVHAIFENRLETGELDECDLTIGELKRIEAAFMPILLGIYHVRVEYPGQDDILHQNETVEPALLG